MEFESLLRERIAGLDMQQLRKRFHEQDEALVIEDFLPRSVLDPLLATLPALKARVNRNYLPGHKKGGSVSRFDLDRHAPQFAAVYRSLELAGFLKALTDRALQSCPREDPHTYALYYYTEVGDHIGWHYDTSYYRGERYTVLIGLIDRSSCKLEFQLHRDNPGRTSEHHSVSLAPGTLVVFNGDKLWHRVTPLGENEERVVLTLEYVTSAEISKVGRFVSNMKDAIAYFGFRQVFRSR
ncbi:MAG: HalD/BesD family halogenase [Chromatiales bacterium]